MSQNRVHHTDAVAAMIKRKVVYLGCILFLLAMGRPAAAQMNFVPGITTIAGNGTSGYSGDGGLATSAKLNTPQGAAYDNAGNLYISDGGVGVVRKIAPNGIITTFAGNGTSGYGGDGGPATSAQLFNPTGIAVDGAGSVYICDTGNNRIRKVDAATGTISTIAGIGGTGGYSGDNGPATAAQLYGPLYLAFDSAGNLYFTDYYNNRVRKITMSSGVITTVAGNGTAATAGDGGLATSASLNGPQGVAIDTAGNLYISEAAGNVVREVAASTGDISTFAGNGTAGFFGDGGAATSAQLNDPYGLAFDATVDGLLISDANNNSVRLVNLSTGNITTVAGNGNPSGGFSGDGGPATSAQFSFPEGAVADASGNLVVVDTFNSAVRELTLANLNFPTTNIGSSSPTRNLQLETTTTETINSISVPQSQGGKQEYSIGTITGCTVGTSNPANTICNIPITFTPAYPGERWIPIEVVTSTGNFNFGLQGIGDGPLVTLTPGIISTVAGNGTAGYSGDGGAATSAKLNAPFYVSVDSAGNLYIADRFNNRIRKVDAVTGIITTVAGNGTAGFSGDGGLATSAELNGPPRITIDGVGNLYIADYNNARIRKVDAATGIITTVAGNGISGYTGDGGPATSAELHLADALAIDSAGNLYISDSTNNVVRKVTAGTGIISTVAGNSTGAGGYSGDGGLATSAKLSNPAGLAFDDARNLYISDYANQRIRKVDAATGIITTVAGNGAAGYTGDGSAATSAKINGAEAVTVDSAGNLYISDSGNNVVRKVATTGIITTVAGSTGGYSGDNGAATSAKLNSPTSLALNGVGYLYIADSNNQRIRKVDMSQSALTYPTATTVGTSDSTDNPRTATIFNAGNASLTIPAPSSSGNNPSIPANFMFDSSSTCPELNSSSSAQTLAPGANCTIAIDFGPNNAGTVNGSAVLTYTAPNGTAATQTIPLSGTATAASTTTTVSGSPSPSAYSQTVTVAATVAPTTGNSLPTGSVQFSVDATNVGSPATLSNGTASFTISTLAVGNHALAAAYTPDTSDFTASNGSTSQTVNKATLGQNGLANLTLTSSPSPSAYSQSVTFTATVPSGATGTVQFNDGATNLGSGTISGTTATLTTSALAAGTHSVTAAYSGDVNYNSATSAADNHVVNKATLGQNGLANLTLSSSPSPSTYGQSVTFTATVPSGATGKVQFNDGATNLGSGTISGTTATLTTSALAAGAHSVTAAYSGDGNYNSATSAADNQVVNKATLGQNGLANLTLSSSPSLSTYGQSVTFTATVPSGVTGTVQFVDGSAVLGTAAISGTTATFATSRLAAGTNSVTAVYGGDANHNSATSAADNAVVNGVATSTTTLSLSPSSVMYGNPATLTAVVAPNFATGTVSFYEGSTLLGTASVDNTGTAVLPISTLNAGVHTITAKYSGDPVVPESTSTAQLTVTQRTGPNGGPAITVTVNDASQTTSANPQFTYSLAGQLVNGDTYATAISGAPTYTTSASPTPNTYSVSLSGLTSANYTLGFVPGTLTVSSASTTTTLATSPASPQYGDPVTLTATVPSGATGSVSFYDGSIFLGMGTVSNGTATLTTATLTAGTHTITATYNGDATNASSQSGPATVTVAKKTGANGGAALTVTVQNASRQSGAADPQFSYVVTGTLIPGDSYATAVTDSPVYSVADTPSSASGATFPVNVSGLSSQNYAIAVVPGALNIVSSSTTATLATSTDSTQYGDPITLTETVTPSGATGTVVFMDGANVLGTGTVSGGVATLTTSSLPAGSYTITATYEGDGTYGASTSAPVTITVGPKTGPIGEPALTVTVASVSRPYGAGNPAFSYTVSGTLLNADTYATALTGVPVYLTTATPTSADGTYPVSILGGLNSNNYSIAFVHAALTVATAAPGSGGTASVTLTSSPNPAAYGSPVTFTATVPATATGTVTFRDGNSALGTGTVANGIATLTTSTLAIGTHTITAVYSGDSNYSSATSAAYSLTVNAVDFTLTLTSSGSQTVIPGNAASYTVQVAPIGASYPGTVTFSATGLPSGATISFSPSTVAATGGTAPIGVQIQTAAQTAAIEKGRDASVSFALALLLLPFTASKRIRKNSRRLFALLILVLGGIAATAGLTGCGSSNGNGFFGQAPETYTITITATSGTIQHSVEVTLNVQ